MAAVAEFERSLIISRTSEGRARAKAAGVRFRREAGEPLSLIAASYGCSARTIMRLGASS